MVRMFIETECGRSVGMLRHSSHILLFSVVIFDLSSTRNTIHVLAATASLKISVIIPALLCYIC